MNEDHEQRRRIRIALVWMAAGLIGVATGFALAIVATVGI